MDEAKIKKILSGPDVKAFLTHHQYMESRPRVSCSQCQFEYVEEDGHDCGQGQVPATQTLSVPDAAVG